MARARVWGKLPALGDFVARGFSPAARDDLDQWLAASLAEARVALGDGWEGVYDQAPPWRFAWADAGRWSAGAMAPSVDAVGRRYPLLVGVDDLDGAAVPGAAAEAEQLLYDALGEGWDADRLHAAVAAMTPAADAAWGAGEGWWTLGADGFNEAHLVGARPPGLMRAMLTMGQGDA